MLLKVGDKVEEFSDKYKISIIVSSIGCTCIGGNDLFDWGYKYDELPDKITIQIGETVIELKELKNV